MIILGKHTDINANILSNYGNYALTISIVLERIGYVLENSVYRYFPNFETNLDNSIMFALGLSIPIKNKIYSLTSDRENVCVIILKSILPNIFDVIDPKDENERSVAPPYISMNWNVLRYSYELLNPDGNFMDLFIKRLNEWNLYNETKLYMIKEMSEMSTIPL